MTKEQLSKRSMQRLLFICSIILSGTQCSRLFAPAMTYTVTTNADSGAGSLRQAIINANANTPFTNTIDFNFLPGPITPVTDLPTITNPVIIDGYLGAPGGSSVNTNLITAANNAQITIEIVGPGAGANLAVTNGLVLGAGSDGSTIRGLCINNFASVDSPGTTYGAGILILSDGNTITGNFIGSNTNGLLSFPNATAINVQGNNNIIGGTTPATRNLLSGHYLGGSSGASRINGVVRISGDGTIVQQNTIGLNAFGTAPLMPDAHQGITTVGAGATTGGTTLIGGPSHLANGNVISGHHAANVVVDLIESSTIVQGNYIGLDVTGSVKIAGNGIGVNFVRSSIVNSPVNSFFQPVNLVISGNTISGNTYGVRVGENSFGGYPLYNTQITNNTIGLNAAKTAAVPNSLDGIWIKYGIDSYIELNVVSGNLGNGILIGKGKNTLIKSNYIGTDTTGTAVLGNGGNGIQLGINVGSGVPAFGDTVGGSKPGDGNLIANNTGNGIEIVSYTQQETIIGNTIIKNGGNGIQIDPNASNNWIGGFRTAGDLRLMGDTSSQGFTNLGPLGISNIISINTEAGISVNDSNLNTLQSNFITGNGGNGISLIDSSNNLIGGLYGSAATTLPPVLGNSVTGNNGFGVEVEQVTGNATDNSILSNRIFNNTSRGIALVTG